MRTPQERAFVETLTSGKANDPALMEGAFRGTRAAFLVQIMREPDGAEILAPAAAFLRIGDREDRRGPFGDRLEVLEKYHCGACRKGGTPTEGKTESYSFYRPPAGRTTARDYPSNPTWPMAWRPYENLIDGELDNRTSGKVTGWMRFFRRGKQPLRVVFDLDGDFAEDIRGKAIRLRNPEPSDKNETLEGDGTYMEGFARVQRGDAGDITAGLPLGPWTEQLAQKLVAEHEYAWDEIGLAGDEPERRRQELADIYRAHIEAGDLHYAYVSYPYIEWFSGRNGRVVLELDPSQVEILDGGEPPREKTPEERAADERRRAQAMASFMGGLVKELSLKNRKRGGDGNVAGIVVG